jgi:branched-subunit amino acid ABC-type transport system permease component
MKDRVIFWLDRQEISFLEFDYLIGLSQLNKSFRTELEGNCSDRHKRTWKETAVTHVMIVLILLLFLLILLTYTTLGQRIRGARL